MEAFKERIPVSSTSAAHHFWPFNLYTFWQHFSDVTQCQSVWLVACTQELQIVKKKLKIPTLEKQVFKLYFLESVEIGHLFIRSFIWKMSLGHSKLETWFSSPSVSEKCALEIVKKNFFGIRKWKKSKSSDQKKKKKKENFFTFLSKNWLKKEKHASLDYLKNVVMRNKFIIWNGPK